MTSNDTFQEIVLITQKLIQNGLSIQEKWPIRKDHKISWENQSDISIVLKNLPYAEKYAALERGNNYNFKMLDGGLIQFMYEFNNTGRKLLSHRLAYFPSPLLERFDDNPQDYEEKYFGDSEFHDLIEKNITSFAIRCDYNWNAPPFKDVEHPYAHIHLGEYEYCRIPVMSPLTPSMFINFILRNFYNYAIRLKDIVIPASNTKFDLCITELEKNLIHFNMI